MFFIYNKKIQNVPLHILLKHFSTFPQFFKHLTFSQHIIILEFLEELLDFLLKKNIRVFFLLKIMVNFIKASSVLSPLVLLFGGVAKPVAPVIYCLK